MAPQPATISLADLQALSGYQANDQKGKILTPVIAQVLPAWLKEFGPRYGYITTTQHGLGGGNTSEVRICLSRLLVLCRQEAAQQSNTEALGILGRDAYDHAKAKSKPGSQIIGFAQFSHIFVRVAASILPPEATCRLIRVEMPREFYKPQQRAYIHISWPAASSA